MTEEYARKNMYDNSKHNPILPQYLLIEKYISIENHRELDLTLKLPEQLINRRNMPE